MLVHALPRLVVPLSLACLAPLAVAQVPAGELAPVEVRARPIIDENRFERFGGQATVVTEAQIQDLNATDLPTALRRTPGVTISRFNPVGSFGGGEGGAVFIRGLGASRPGGEIKTFIDGVPFYMGIWNHPLLDLLPVNGMSAIEVLKGPQPAIVGNTLASINLTTRSAPAEGAGGNVSLQGGSFGTVLQQLNAGVRSGPWSGVLAQGYQRSDGDRADSDGRLLNVLAKGSYAISSAWTAGLTLLYVDNTVDDPGPVGAPQLRNGTYDTQGLLAIASLEHVHDASRGSVRLYAGDGDGNWYRQAGTTGDTLTSWDTWGLRAREELAPWNGGELLLGVDYDQWTGSVDFKPTNRPDSTFDAPTFRLLSPYVGVAQTFAWDGLEIVPSIGVRYYDHNQFDAEWSPFAGLKVSKGDVYLHAGASRGVNYPGLDVVVFSTSVVTGLGQSWRRLDAEKSEHYQVGVGYAAGPLAADLVYFRDRITDRYVWVPPPPPPPAYVNRGGQTVTGVEATVRYDLSPALGVFAGATLPDGTPADVPYLPEQTFVVGFTGTTGSFRYSLDGQYRSSMYVLTRGRTATAVNTSRVDSAFLLNGRLFYTLPASFGRRSELMLALDNITDEDYEYRPGYPMPGTSFLVGLNYGF
jgi:iron complex outermembrane receptor protein